MFSRKGIALASSLLGACGLGLFCWGNQKNKAQLHCLGWGKSEPAKTEAPVKKEFWARSKHCEKVSQPQKLFLLSGTANLPLAEGIAKHLGTKLANAHVGRFNDGEINIQIKDNVRGKDVYIVQPTCPPVNDNLMELLLLISTARRASAKQVTAVVPYYGYARQDRKTASRVPISAADVARLLETVGVDRLIATDLHCGQIAGFFSPKVPADNLDGSSVLLEHILENKGFFNDPSKVVVISPDAGGVARAKKFQGLLNNRGFKDVGLAMIIKQRKEAAKIERMDLVGNVEGKDCVIIDDIIDTAGTVCEAAKELKNKGAQKVYVFATHGLFSGEAYKRIETSVVEQVIVTNSIPLRPGAPKGKITQLDLSVLIAEAIRRTNQKESISDMFT